MFKVFTFGFETCNKLNLVTDLSIDQWSSAGCWPYSNQVPFQLMDIPRWFLINTFLRFGFSRCLQALVHWCGSHAARGESEWCIGLLLWHLAAQTVAAIHLSSCRWLLLSSEPRVHKSTELLWHKTPDITPDLPRDQTSILQTTGYEQSFSFRNAFIRNSKCRHTSPINCGYSQNVILYFTR